MKLSELVEYLGTLQKALGDAEVKVQQRSQHDYSSEPIVRDVLQITHRLILPLRPGSVVVVPEGTVMVPADSEPQKQVIIVFDEKTK